MTPQSDFLVNDYVTSLSTRKRGHDRMFETPLNGSTIHIHNGVLRSPQRSRSRPVQIDHSSSISSNAKYNRRTNAYNFDNGFEEDEKQNTQDAFHETPTQRHNQYSMHKKQNQHQSRSASYKHQPSSVASQASPRAARTNNNANSYDPRHLIVAIEKERLDRMNDIRNLTDNILRQQSPSLLPMSPSPYDVQSTQRHQPSATTAAANADAATVQPLATPSSPVSHQMPGHSIGDYQLLINNLLEESKSNQTVIAQLVQQNQATNQQLDQIKSERQQQQQQKQQQEQEQNIRQTQHAQQQTQLSQQNGVLSHSSQPQQHLSNRHTKDSNATDNNTQPQSNRTQQKQQQSRSRRASNDKTDKEQDNEQDNSAASSDKNMKSNNHLRNQNRDYRRQSILDLLQDSSHPSNNNEIVEANHQLQSQIILLKKQFKQAQKQMINFKEINSKQAQLIAHLEQQKAHFADKVQYNMNRHVDITKRQCKVLTSTWLKWKNSLVATKHAHHVVVEIKKSHIKNDQKKHANKQVAINWADQRDSKSLHLLFDKWFNKTLIKMKKSRHEVDLSQIIDVRHVNRIKTNVLHFWKTQSLDRISQYHEIKLKKLKYVTKLKQLELECDYDNDDDSIRNVANNHSHRVSFKDEQQSHSSHREATLSLQQQQNQKSTDRSNVLSPGNGNGNGVTIDDLASPMSSESIKSPNDQQQQHQMTETKDNTTATNKSPQQQQQQQQQQSSTDHPNDQNQQHNHQQQMLHSKSVDDLKRQHEANLLAQSVSLQESYNARIQQMQHDMNKKMALVSDKLKTLKHESFMTSLASSRNATRQHSTSHTTATSPRHHNNTTQAHALTHTTNTISNLRPVQSSSNNHVASTITTTSNRSPKSFTFDKPPTQQHQHPPVKLTTLKLPTLNVISPPHSNNQFISPTIKPTLISQYSIKSQHSNNATSPNQNPTNTPSNRPHSQQARSISPAAAAYEDSKTSRTTANDTHHIQQTSRPFHRPTLSTNLPRTALTSPKSATHTTSK